MTVVVGVDGTAGGRSAVRLAALIVLATRGDGRVARMLGAVSQYVLRNAPCPVLLVPEAGRAARPVSNPLRG